MKLDVEKLLTRGVAEVIQKKHLALRLAQGKKKLRVKFGVDPTAPDLHLGHTVALRKLRQFQDAGHKIILILGDFTARIGDPSGQSETRKPLNEKEIQKNMKSYLAQAGRIINLKKIEVHYNSAWFLKKDAIKTILELSQAGTIQQVLHRADFRKRLDRGQDITLLEALYSLFQGYDSVKVKADIEVGGTDQKFNLLMGRRVQRHFKMPEQNVITLPLLEGTDGIRKMSKTYDNYIGLEEGPEMMFGKIMSVPDNLILKYTELLTDMPLKKDSDPRRAKLKLAKTLVGMYHGKLAAEKSEKEFIKVISKKGIPSEVKSLKLKVKSLKLVDLLTETKLAPSKSEAYRLIKQGGVKLGNKKQTDPNKVIKIEKETLLQVGKRKFLKLK